MTPRTLGFWIAVAIVAVLAFAPSLAFAAGKSYEIGLTGGIGLPQGDFKDETNGLDGRNGPQLGIDFSYHVAEAIAVGVDGSWTRNKHGAEGSVEDLGGGITLTANKDEFTTVQYGVHGKYLFRVAGSFKPYGLLGFGFYNIKENWEYTYDDGVNPPTLFTDESENFDQPGAKFGWKLGAGATYMASPTIGLGLAVDYNSFALDEAKYGVSSVPSVNVRGRLTYHITPK